jgi:hypothetical protein
MHAIERRVEILEIKMETHYITKNGPNKREFFSERHSLFRQRKGILHLKNMHLILNSTQRLILV